MTLQKSVVIGVGSCLPACTLTNHDLAKSVETSHQWIVERTGIKQRHVAGAKDTTVTLATTAALRAMKNAGCGPDDIDLIVLATTTPDHTFPASATEVQARLGVTRGFAYDISAACAGFVYAIAAVDAQLKTGAARVALVIGADTFSRLIDWTDRTTCVLFGDGAGAIVLETRDAATCKRGILASHLESDGRNTSKLYVDGSPATTQTTGYIRMHGAGVFKSAITMLPNITHTLLQKTGTSIDSVDWFIPHQANKRIIDNSIKKLGIDPAKAIITIDIHGNTSAASIPLALDTAVKDGRIHEGNLLLLEALGAGFTCGSSLVCW